MKIFYHCSLTIALFLQAMTGISQEYKSSYFTKLNGNGYYNSGKGLSQGIQISPTSDQGYLVAGAGFQSPQITWNPILTKVNFAGSVQFSARLNMVGTMNSAIEYDANNYLAIGDSMAIYLASFDSCGNMRWLKSYRNQYVPKSRKLIKTKDGGLLIAGDVYLTGSDKRGLLIKTDASGNLQWSTAYGPASTDIYCADARQTDDGGFIICGRNDVGIGAPYVMKVSATGTVEWGYSYSLRITDGSTVFNQGGANAVRETASGDFVVFLSGVGNSGRRVGMMKIDASGEVRWNRFFVDSNSAIPLGSKGTSSYGGMVNKDGSFTLFGVTSARSGSLNNQSELLILKTDSAGEVLWSKVYSAGDGLVSFAGTGAGNRGSVSELVENADGGFSMGAACAKSDIFEGADMVIIKTDSTGRSGCGYYELRHSSQSSVPVKTVFSTSVASNIAQAPTAVTASPTYPDLLATQSNLCNVVYYGADSFSSTGILGPVKICALPSAKVYYIPDLGSGYSYNWTISGGTVLNGQGTNSITVNWTDVQNKSVTVSFAGKCKSFSLNLPVGNATAIPVPAIDVSGDTLKTITAAAYQWYLNGTPIPGANQQTYIAQQSGQYKVEVKDANGCNAFSETEDIIKSSIETTGFGSIKIYPNPYLSDKFRLEIPEELVGADVAVLDMNGRVLYQEKANNTNFDVITTVMSGCYLFRVQNGKNVYYMRLVKQ